MIARFAGVAGVGTVALTVALALAGSARGLALYAYVLFLAAATLLSVMRRLGAALPQTRSLDRLLLRRREPVERVEQLARLQNALAGAALSASELHLKLRPVVEEIAAGRLARRHAVDLRHQRERARALLGPRTWELVRPDRERPTREGPGWARAELDALVDELEAI